MNPGSIKVEKQLHIPRYPSKIYGAKINIHLIYKIKINYSIQQDMI